MESSMSSTGPRAEEFREEELPRGLPQHLGWSALVEQYGRAMARVGYLEWEVERLRQELQEARNGPASDSGLQALLEEKETELRQRNSTIASLRLQVSNLNLQLAAAEEKLKLAAEGNYVRVRRRHRPWWQFWKRRHRRRSS